MTEDQAKAICLAEDLSDYSREELREADEWVKTHALAKLSSVLNGQPNTLREYVLLMARCHFGSGETDEFLTSMGCYPDWMKP
jgi:hypothetical protein